MIAEDVEVKRQLVREVEAQRFMPDLAMRFSEHSVVK